MIFHELATNACKYGALSVDDGQIEVSWTIDVDPHEIRVCLVWRESDGQEAASADRVGYGTTLINRLVKSLPSGQCTREFQAPGLDFTMRWAVRA